mgnify:CR=1 FL=1
MQQGKNRTDVSFALIVHPIAQNIHIYKAYKEHAKYNVACPRLRSIIGSNSLLIRDAPPKWKP